MVSRKNLRTLGVFSGETGYLPAVEQRRIGFRDRSDPAAFLTCLAVMGSKDKT